MTTVFRTTWDKFEYQPTDNDVLWASTALYGETRGGGGEAEWGRILWTWMNRFMLHTPRPRVWPTLANLIKNHSQAVNPKWRLGGSRCLTSNCSSGCTPPQLEWRNQMADILEMNGEGIPTTQQEFVGRFFDGHVPPPSTVDGTPLLDFGVTSIAKQHGTRYGSSNYFLTRHQLMLSPLIHNFQEGTVQVEGGVEDDMDTDATSCIAAGLFLLAAGGLMYWFLSGGKKK